MWAPVHADTLNPSLNALQIFLSLSSTFSIFYYTRVEEIDLCISIHVYIAYMRERERMNYFPHDFSDSEVWVLLHKDFLPAKP